MDTNTKSVTPRRRKRPYVPTWGGAERIEEYQLSPRSTIRSGDWVKVKAPHGHLGRVVAIWAEPGGETSVQVRRYVGTQVGENRFYRPDRIQRKRFQDRLA